MIRARFEALSRRPLRAGLVVAALPLAAGLLYLAVHGAPQPIVHDEFSNLLAADTFAHGRLANPAHPFWRHFQSANELAYPRYVSKYPPAQGLFLALGQLLGAPLLGAILCAALAAAAVYWMLLAFVEPEWALAGGCLAATHTVTLYWLTNYWGGQAALLGGALVLGAWKRLTQGRERSASLWLGVGLAVLANSRPLEGLVFSAPLVAQLAWRRRRLLPAAGVLAACFVWMGLYNSRATGSVVELPYLAYEKQYNPAPLFVWQSGLREVPDPGVPEIRNLWFEWNLGQYRRQRAPDGLASAFAEKLSDLDAAWLEPWPVKLLLALPLAGPCGAEALWLGWLMLAGAGLVLTQLFYYPHYTAPLGAVFFLLLALGLRRAWAWRGRGKPLGKAAVAVFVLWSAVRSVLFLGGKAESPRAAWSYFREQAVERLRGMGGRHLVLVHYGPGSSYHEDWVANGADIDAQDVVWAWSLDDDQALEDYYPDRSVWRLDVTPPTPSFKPIRGPLTSGTAGSASRPPARRD